MATYRFDEQALAARLSRATRRLRLKYGGLTLLVIGLGVLNYERNEQRHWQTELVALALCAILLVAGYLNGHRAIAAAKAHPMEFYRLTVGVDCVECHDSRTGCTVLHVSEIASVRRTANGLLLQGMSKDRCILVPRDLQDYAGCVAELQSIGVRV